MKIEYHPWRKFEALGQKALQRIGDKLPKQHAEELLRDFHTGDVMIANLQTSTRLDVTNLRQFTDTLDRIMNDPDVHALWVQLFDAKVSELGRGLDGYESLELWSQAARQLGKLPNAEE